MPLANSLHAQWTIAALEVGRHVLCEKPFASNAAQAADMVAAAERAGLVLVEGQHWRYHPVADRMLELAGAVGPLEQLEVRFSVSIPSDNMRYSFALAGGSFMLANSLAEAQYSNHLVFLLPAAVQRRSDHDPPGDVGNG